LALYAEAEDRPTLKRESLAGLERSLDE
jgi:hypothetical protein